MSSEHSIEVRGLSKSYAISRSSSTMLGDVIAQRIRHPLRGRPETFWALRDVSFSARPGEVVGVIGKNGAGKSTLLKVLSRITEPTKGEIELRGRLGCLLEVGTGFHPELTGRENVFLNGSILGMRKNEILAQFDEIVEFSGVERFLDTPVKRYSSGMYVRLAFAVAAHLNPEILIIDEVLAVGDLEFQKKCLGKMEDVAAQQGRTVVFVSHNVAAVQTLCTRTIVLEEGRVVHDGATSEALAQYVALQDRHSVGPGIFKLNDRTNPHGRDAALLLEMLTIADSSGPVSSFRTGDAALFAIEAVSVPDKPWYRIHIRNDLDQVVLASDTRMVSPAERVAGGTVCFRLESLPLLPGRYFVDVGIGDAQRRESTDFVVSAGAFQVDSPDLYGPDYQIIPVDGPYYVPPLWEATSDPDGDGPTAPPEASPAS